MASWKRLFSKKHKKSLRKLEREYDEWLRHVQETYGPNRAVNFSQDKQQKYNLSQQRQLG